MVKRNGKKALKTRDFDEEIESISSGDDKKGHDIDHYESDDGETAQEKKLRMVKDYLAQMEKEKTDVAEDSGTHDQPPNPFNLDSLKPDSKHPKIISHKYYGTEPRKIISRRNGHRLTPTCAIFTPDSQFIFSSGKDGRMIKWAVDNLRKLNVLLPHVQLSQNASTQKCVPKQILALSISSDAKYLVSGGHDLFIHVWNPENLDHIHTFKGHRAYITGLAFRLDTHQLFSSAHDRFIMLWDLDHKRNIDTLFGHKESITDIDSYVSERAISSGGCDSSVHLWKIVEESQLIYKVERSSLDRVRYIDEEHFVTGSDEGEVSLWHVAKKKPICTFKHGRVGKSQAQPPDPVVPGEGNEAMDFPPDLLKCPGFYEFSFKSQASPYWVASLQGNDFSREPKSLNGAAINPYWITALAVIPNSDVIATGSSDCYIRVWKCSDSYKKTSLVCQVRMVGFINSLQFSPDERYLLAAVGKEHRLGRWKILPVPNCIALIDLLPN